MEPNQTAAPVEKKSKKGLIITIVVIVVIILALWLVKGMSKTAPAALDTTATNVASTTTTQ